MKAKITKRAVDAAAAVFADQFLWDPEVKGFGLKTTLAGAKVYILQYRCKGRLRRYTIGRHGSPWTPDEARAEAIRLLAQAVRGVDPADAKHADRADVTFAAFSERYLKEHADLHKKRRSAELDRQLLRSHILPAIGARRLTTITRADLARMHRALAKTPIAANRALNLASAMLSRAERWGLRPEGSNPARRVDKFKERGRERFLSEAELARLGEALAQVERSGFSPPAAIAALRLLILTGARKSEILALEWDWVKFERGMLELPDSKTGAKTIYLNAPALELLNALPRLAGNPYVLPGERAGAHLVNVEKTWRRIRALAGLTEVRIHDLRHSYAAVGAGAGFSLPLIGALLGHTEVATTQRYAHLAADPVRQANEAIGARISAAMKGPQGSAVVPIKRGGPANAGA